MSEILDTVREQHRTNLERDRDTVLHGLPGEAYTSEAFLQREFETVFSSTWVFVACAHEVARPGDAMPVQVAGKPVLLVRNAQGELKAFHNVCRHRGVTLVDSPCRAARNFTCPYHAWSYDLDGRLEAAPHFGGFRKQEVEGFDRASHGLFPVRVDTFLDWVFVNLDGNAPPLEEYVQPLRRVTADFPVDSLTPLTGVDLGEVQTNWKFLMENFIEPYHVSTVHSSTAAGQPLQDHFSFIEEHCVGAGVDPKSTGGGDGQYLDMSARYVTLFPNFVLGIYLPDQVGVHVNVPVAPGVTRQRRVIYHMGDGPFPDRTQIEGLQRLWYDVHREDHAICERLQKGRQSPAMADGGLMSGYWEDSARAFQKMVMDHVNAND